MLTKVVEQNKGPKYQGEAVPIKDDEWAEFLRCSTKTVTRKREKLASYGMEAECGWSWLHNEPHVYHYKVNIFRLLEALGRSVAETLFKNSECPW